MKKQMQKEVVETTKGFFIAFANEVQELKKKNLMNSGRNGIFYKKEDLLSTINSKMIPESKKQEMNIVEIEVPHCAIVSPNCIRFGIKCGKDIPIIKIQSFTKAMKEVEKMAVA